MRSLGAAVVLKHRIGRTLRWGVALAAIVFVAWVVPVRDQCWDPRSPASTRLPVTRDTQGGGPCVLHARTGDVRIDAVECDRLRCEPGLVTTIGHARVGMLSILLVLYTLSTVAWAARWRALLGFTGVDLPLGEVWRISIEAQAGGVLLPGGIGGDALRVAAVMARLPRGEEERSRLSIAVASVLLDRTLGLAVVGAVAAGLAFAWGGAQAGALANIFASLPIAFILCVIVVRNLPLDRIRWLANGRAGRIAKPLLDYARDPGAPRALAVAAALSALVAGSQFMAIRGLVAAVGGVPTSEKWVYVGTAMAFVVSALPALPGGWGTADATYVFFFGLAGLLPGTALAVCLLYRLFWYVLALAGAVLYLTRSAERRTKLNTPRL
jgi:uncharacterized membrane protein YbhN (UPF0104 family)